MTNYRLPFDLDPLKELDQFALLACQKYNFGNATDWFGCFRGGTFAVHHRVGAVQRHYYDVHEWIPKPGVLGDAEYHLASLWFNLDSALECLVFGLNGLGFAACPSGFRDVTDRNALRKVAPRDLINSGDKNAPPGYSEIFPQLQRHWESSLDLIAFVVDQHDVSKHRSTTFVGGKARDDPPPGFFAALGIEGDVAKEAIFRPMAEIILIPDPKMPPSDRSPVAREDQVLLEDLVPRYCDFFNTGLVLALDDSKMNIHLKHDDFVRTSDDA